MKAEGMKMKTASKLTLTTLAAEINRAHRRCEESALSAVQCAAEAGKLLLQARAMCDHGEWVPWLKANF